MQLGPHLEGRPRAWTPGEAPRVDVGHDPGDRTHPGEEGEPRLPPDDPAMCCADRVCACVDPRAPQARWSHAS